MARKPGRYDPQSREELRRTLAGLHETFRPASADEAGLPGLVPAPAAGDDAKFLRGDGTYQSPGGGNSWVPDHHGTTDIEAWYNWGSVFVSSASTVAAAALSVDTLYAIPSYRSRGGSIDRLGFEITQTGGAGSKVRAGIYAAKSSTNVYPGALLLDSGEEDGTSVAIHAVTVSATLLADTLYWFVFLFGTGSPGFRVSGAVGAPDVLGNSASNFTERRTIITAAQAYGALPSTFPSGGTPSVGIGASNAFFPMLNVRYAA